MVNSAAALIDEKGGPTAFADKLGMSAGAVRVWKHRNRFPREAWPEIITTFPDISLERMIEMEALAREASEAGVSP